MHKIKIPSSVHAQSSTCIIHTHLSSLKFSVIFLLEFARCFPAGLTDS